MMNLNLIEKNIYKNFFPFLLLLTIILLSGCVSSVKFCGENNTLLSKTNSTVWLLDPVMDIKCYTSNGTRKPDPIICVATNILAIEKLFSIMNTSTFEQITGPVFGTPTFDVLIIYHGQQDIDRILLSTSGWFRVYYKRRKIYEGVLNNNVLDELYVCYTNLWNGHPVQGDQLLLNHWPSAWPLSLKETAYWEEYNKHRKSSKTNTIDLQEIIIE